MERTERLLDLVALLLDASEPVPFARLRELFPEDYGSGTREAAERKLERDKAELVALGVPLEFVPPDEDHELGGYRVDRKAFFLRDPRLSPEETAALYAAGSASLASHDFLFAQDLRHALRKIALAGADSAPRLSALASLPARRLHIVRPGDPERAPKLRALFDAAARRKRVHIVYRAAPALGLPARTERTERDVDPYGLAFRSGAWRLIAYCHLRRAMRVFAVDGIASLEVNAQKPQQPDFQVPEDFDAGEAASAPPWRWAGPSALQVVLRFAPGSEAIAERTFEDAAEPAAGGARLTLAVTSLDGLLPQVLGSGDRVWIESPPEARARAEAALRALAERLAKHAPSPIGAAPDADGAPSRATTARAGGKKVRGEAEHETQERLRRLLLLVPAVRRRQGARVEDLAGELGLAPAQLLEDIDLLSLVGRPPYTPGDLIDICVDERNRVYVTLDQSFSQPPQLTPLEALALTAAAEAVAPADPAVTAGLAKLTSQLPPGARGLFAGLARRVRTAAPPPRGTSPFIARLRDAAERRREMLIDYDKQTGGESEERRLEPWAVVDHAGRWYVYGRDAGRGAERSFRVDRIRGLRETGRTFPDPGPLDPALFQRESFFFPTGAERTVTLRFSPRSAAWALARYGARAQALPDGSLEASIESAGSAYAVSLALSLAGEAEVIDPPEVRAALEEAVGRALRRYEGGAP